MPHFEFFLSCQETKWHFSLLMLDIKNISKYWKPLSLFLFNRICISQQRLTAVTNNPKGSYYHKGLSRDHVTVQSRLEGTLLHEIIWRSMYHLFSVSSILEDIIWAPAGQGQENGGFHRRSRPRCSAVTSATFSDPSSIVCPHIPAGDSGNESLAGFPGGKGSIAFHMPLPQMPVFAKCSNGSFCTGARDRTVLSPTFFHYKYK